MESWSTAKSAWPMWRRPVTLGGGMGIVNGDARLVKGVKNAEEEEEGESSGALFLDNDDFSSSFSSSFSFSFLKQQQQQQHHDQPRLKKPFVLPPKLVSSPSQPSSSPLQDEFLVGKSSVPSNFVPPEPGEPKGHP
eukprot:CAMPEP_0175061476 /NCGR_PEP_ID=MMETSP0052_2-20121109/13606_1 /TAXON_ID=51329 ORGANISM="Polytomella parva, Strain SAG 63-3" /NCGR_SAMPLE_ID=MMETSP0052_2 /ASSEMBLY_ACC=CAM_ASM_000194 /LENGTH=135 /DNA_ID=CAMNT_0016327335 /DNA_START=427 /DNA_END=835 /DNA_ORIENTATION=-